MKTKIFKTVLLLISVAVVVMCLSMSLTFIDQAYAVNATEQLERDSAYYLMETQSVMTHVVKWSFAAILALQCLIGYKIWFKQNG